MVQYIHVLSKSLRHLGDRGLALDPSADQQRIAFRVPEHSLVHQVVETLPDIGRGELEYFPVTFILDAFFQEEIKYVKAAPFRLVPHLLKHVAHGFEYP